MRRQESYIVYVYKIYTVRVKYKADSNDAKYMFHLQVDSL